MSEKIVDIEAYKVSKLVGNSVLFIRSLYKYASDNNMLTEQDKESIEKELNLLKEAIENKTKGKN